jgi:hypothetical protein
MDIFISYTHVDNLPLEEGKKGWVDDFHRALEVRLLQWLGRTQQQLQVWRDPKLTGNDLFSDEIFDRLRDVRVLVSVVSPRYLNSEFCTRELDAFYDRAAEAGQLTVGGNKARIFKVVKMPIPVEEQPESLRPLLGYDFFRLDPESGRPRELNEIFGAEAKTAFWVGVDDLALDVANLLEAMESDPAAAPTPSPDRMVVYLAAATQDVNEEHAAIRRELERNGFTVVPGRPLPVVAAEIEAQVREELAGARLAVILVGQGYGFVPEGGTVSVVEMQSDLAAERSRTGALRRLVWTRPGVKADEERQAAFLERLRSGDGFDAHSDLLETGLEELKTEIHERLQALSQPPRPPPVPAGERTATAYLVCDQLDLDAVGAVQDALLAAGVEPVLPAFEGDEAELREDHEDKLRTCDGILLYYGAGTDLWLSRKMREVDKIRGQGRAAPPAARSVLVAAPASPAKGRLRSREWEVIGHDGPLQPESLGPFVARLAEGRA